MHTIYYFSGTGSSLRVARQLASAMGTDLVPMAEAVAQGPAPKRPAVAERQCVGLVFPVYAWGLPLVVKRCLRLLPPPDASAYVWAVMTCGDDVGRTDRELRRLLCACGWPEVEAVYSVRMPNTYVCLPGFDVDSPEVARRKREEAERRVAEVIMPALQQRRRGLTDVVPGAWPWLKSHVLRPLFNWCLTNPAHFAVDKKQCNRCGACSRTCPLGAVRPDAEGYPSWERHCTHCLACYHVCRRHAVSYGPFTRGKGQVNVERENRT